MNLLAPLRYRLFRWLVAARVATYLANAIGPVALAFAVLDLTGSVVDLGLVVGARSIALVTLLLFGGVLADRLPRGVILLGSCSAAAVTQCAVGLSVLTGVASIPLLTVLSVANGAVGAIALPAALALTPQTVPADLLRPANAIARMGATTAMTVGAPLGGLVAAVSGPGWALTASALVFALAASCYLRVRVPVAERAGERSRPLADLRAGWTEFRSRTWVWVVVVQFMLVNAAVIGGTHVLGPAIADATVGRTAWGSCSVSRRSAPSSPPAGGPAAHCSSGWHWSCSTRCPCSHSGSRRTPRC